MKAKQAWHRPCQVCGQDNRDSVYTNQLAVLDHQDMSYRITSCSKCGFHYAAYLPAPEEYQRYYRALSKYDVVLPVSNVPGVDAYRAQHAVTFVSDYLKGDARIVDLGCGAGTLLAAFAGAGWHSLSGIDPAPNAHIQAKNCYNLTQVRTGELEQVHDIPELAEASLVCLMGVLEHLPLLREHMQALSDTLGPDAMMLIEVPASERFIADDFEPFGEFSLEHIQFFSQISLNNLMSSLGWEPVKTEILELPQGTTDSLLCLYQRAVSAELSQPETNDELSLYITESTKRLAPALNTIMESDGELIIFGAGSHTARLLPYLRQGDCLQRVLAIVDNNPNLQGKQMDRWVVAQPEQVLKLYPDAKVLVSSYRSQHAIADALKKHYSNPILTIYSA
jgi:SAM-dependent methyltransferase